MTKTRQKAASHSSPAYNLVRDHFSFLSDRVRRNHGFVVKTVGDAVMAAFSRPDHAVRAALSIQDDLQASTLPEAEALSATPIVLKLGYTPDPASQSRRAMCLTISGPP